MAYRGRHQHRSRLGCLARIVTFLVLVAFFAATVLINYQFLRFPILSTAIEGAILLTALIIALICYFIN